MTQLEYQLPLEISFIKDDINRIRKYNPTSDIRPDIEIEYIMISKTIRLLSRLGLIDRQEREDLIDDLRLTCLEFRNQYPFDES